MSRKPYVSDLTDEQWALIEPLIPPAKPGGRPRKTEMREVFNAILYLLRTGCCWRLLPHDLPPYTTVSEYYHQWRREGLWERLNASLREQVREQAGREKEPSAAIIDSQSVKTTDKGGRSVVTTPVRKSKGASVTSPSTR